MSRSFGTGLLLCGAPVVAAALAGGRFTSMGIGPWYDGLAKPSWTPPGAIIGAVWTGLYLLIATAGALVWARSAAPPAGFIGLFVVNMFLNALWCYLFFAARRPAAALVEIAVLEMTCIGLVLLAARSSPAAAWMLAPYAAWVAFAGFLNGTIVKLAG